jgi:hypothetical protein
MLFTLYCFAQFLISFPFSWLAQFWSCLFGPLFFFCRISNTFYISFFLGPVLASIKFAFLIYPCFMQNCSLMDLSCHYLTLLGGSYLDEPQCSGFPSINNFVSMTLELCKTRQDLRDILNTIRIHWNIYKSCGPEDRKNMKTTQNETIHGFIEY